MAETAEQLVRLIVGAVSNAALYAPEHAQVRRLVAGAHECLAGLLSEKEELAFLVVDDELVLDGRPMGRGMHLNRFAELLRNRGIGSIRFSRGVRPEEIQALAQTFSLNKDRRRDPRSSEHIHLGVLGEASGGGGDEMVTISLADLSAEETAKVSEIYDNVRRHDRLSVKGLYEIVSNFVDNFARETEPFLALAPLRALDEYTFTHSTNVCILNIGQAMSLGVEGQLLKDIGIAAMLHDIGKLFIPEEVLTKPGKLDPDEWKLMQEHPVRGAARLLDTPGVPRLAVVVAYEHHMRYDGGGYPAAPVDWRQNLVSQMTAVSDFFDAMRTKRSYREALEAGRIAGIMQEQAGKSLHPGLVRNFFRILKEAVRRDGGPEAPPPEEGNPAPPP